MTEKSSQMDGWSYSTKFFRLVALRVCFSMHCPVFVQPRDTAAKNPRDYERTIEPWLQVSTIVSLPGVDALCFTSNCFLRSLYILSCLVSCDGKRLCQLLHVRAALASISAVASSILHSPSTSVGSLAFAPHSNSSVKNFVDAWTVAKHNGLRYITLH